MFTVTIWKQSAHMVGIKFLLLRHCTWNSAQKDYYEAVLFLFYLIGPNSLNSMRYSGALLQAGSLYLNISLLLPKNTWHCKKKGILFSDVSILFSGHKCLIKTLLRWAESYFFHFRWNKSHHSIIKYTPIKLCTHTCSFSFVKWKIKTWSAME